MKWEFHGNLQHIISSLKVNPVIPGDENVARKEAASFTYSSHKFKKRAKPTLKVSKDMYYYDDEYDL